MTLATLSTGPRVIPGSRRREAKPSDTPDSVHLRAALVEEAQSIARRLDTLALRAADDVNWLTVDAAGERSVAVTPMGVHLYSGFAGVVLFLATLGRMTGSKEHTPLITDALAAMQRRLGRLAESGTIGIGAYGGLGGIVYTLVHVAALTHAPHLLRSAAAFLPTIDSLVEQDKGLDVVAGAAGCILGLACLHRAAPSEDIIRVAVKCGDHLVKHARPQQYGVAWPNPASRDLPLLGMAHGAAGIAWALCELATLSGKERFLTTAKKALVYERSLFSPAYGNWPDLRLPTATKGGGVNGLGKRRAYPTSWCHGAPGIGIARLMCIPWFGDAATRKEIRVALETTLKHGFGGGHSLCHGDLGNVDILLLASEILGESRWRVQADRAAANTMRSGLPPNCWTLS